MPPNQPVEHSVYYIPTGDLHLKVCGLVAFYVWLSDGFWMSLKVDNVKFRVHSFFFTRDSEKFRQHITSSVGPDQPRPGSAENPISITNTTPTEFAKFLYVFYNE